MNNSEAHKERMNDEEKKLTQRSTRKFNSSIRSNFAVERLLSLNTEVSASAICVEELLRAAKEKNEYFVGRVPLFSVMDDSNSSYLNGCRNAPNLIRNAFMCSSGSYDLYFCDDAKFINTETGIVDLGNLKCNESDYQNHEDICKLSKTIYELNVSINKTNGYKALPLMILGGDHSITYPIVKGIKQFDEKSKIGVIQFDAHPDLYPPHLIDEDKPYSHASPFYNLLETESIDQILQVGLRCMTKAQQATLKKYNDRIAQLYMEQLFGCNLNYYDALMQKLQMWLKKCKERGVGQFYITIDIDVLDPSFAPGISHYEPMGLSTKELFFGLDIVMKELLKNEENTIIGCDIVEYNPGADYNHMTAFVAAKLMRRLAANFLRF